MSYKRKASPDTRRRRSRFMRGVAWSVVWLTIILVISLFGLLFSAQAMYGLTLQQIGEGIQTYLVQAGYLDPSPPRSVAMLAEPIRAIPPREVIPSAQEPDPSSQPAPHDLIISSIAGTITLTPTITSTPTATATETTTMTATSTETPTGTLTPSVTPTRTPYPTWTPTRTPTRTRTPRPTQTYTPRPSPTVTNTWDPAIPTYTLAPTNTVTPTNIVAPTATETPLSETCSYALNTGFEDQIVQLINNERQSRGLYAYRVQSQLRAAARVQAADMACNHFAGHTGSDGSNVRDRVARQGYSWSWIGENYMISQNPTSAFNWWMNSGPHTANILSPNYTEFGVGYVYSSESDYGGYFVVVFARP
ncbi:MAG: CAP domain-containing protein [Anaerolineales bacterium]|nr:MAG: CAP domain-containing protein [Anaerolineales bacterium]